VTGDLHIERTLRMSGTIPLLPLFRFMTRTGTALSFLSYMCVCVLHVVMAELVMHFSGHLLNVS
jgi:hypothetical protein